MFCENDHYTYTKHDGLMGPNKILLCDVNEYPRTRLVELRITIVLFVFTVTVYVREYDPESCY